MRNCEQEPKSETKLPIAPCFGLAHGTNEDKLRFIGGVNIALIESMSALASDRP